MYVCIRISIYVYSIFNLIALPTKCDLILIIGESERPDPPFQVCFGFE